MWRKPPSQSAGLCTWSTVALWNSERTIPGRPLSAWWWSQCPRPRPTSEQDVVAATAQESVIAFIQVCVAFLKDFRLSQSAWALESVPIISPHKIQTSFTSSVTRPPATFLPSFLPEKNLLSTIENFHATFTRLQKQENPFLISDWFVSKNLVTPDSGWWSLANVGLVKES